MLALVPLEGVVDAAVCQKLISFADLIADHLHHRIADLFFFIPDAQIDGIGLDFVALHELREVRIPHRRRGGCHTGEDIGLMSCPECKQRGQGIAAKKQADVIGWMLLLDCRDGHIQQDIQRLRAEPGKVFLAEQPRGDPRRQILIPVGHAHACQKEIVGAGELFDVVDLQRHPPKKRPLNHLDQHGLRLPFSIIINLLAQ